jgi:putative ATP-binding cassette transporter
MNLLSLLLRVSRRRLFLAVALGLASGACNVGLIALISSALSNPSALGWRLIAGLGALGLTMMSAKICAQVVLTRLSQQAVFDLRMHLSRKILATPLRHLEQIGSHRLLAALTTDVVAITNGLLGIPDICISAAVILGCLLYLGWISWMVLLPLLVFAFFGVVTYQVPLVKALHYLRLARDEQDGLFKHFRALTQGLKELKLHHSRRENFVEEAFHSTASKYRRYNVIGGIIYAAAASWGQVLFFLLIGLLFIGLPHTGALRAQTLAAYVLTILFLRSPLESITSVLPTLGQAGIASQRVETIGLSLSGLHQLESDQLSRHSVPCYDTIELRGVTYAYHREREDGTFLLGPINLTLRPGELTFLIGGNGSGKTTLAKLVTGLYVPESGEVRVGGRRITDQTREWYRQHFSVVFSDFYLFDSLRGLGVGEIRDLDAKARGYLAELQVDHKVRIVDGMLSTTELSQGQRKRLALLAAYLEDRPVYVFDEWACDQDPVFKDIFYRKILQELKARGKSVLVITHDDKYLDAADRIVKLEDGKVEYGGAGTECVPVLLAQPAPVHLA